MSAPHRWSKFWWQDWRSDSSLRACSLAARGLWMELLCIAHEGTPYGHVTIGGVAPTDAELARMVGVSVKKIPILISELERYGVFSRDDNGVIFCRRMIRDNATSEAGRENISKRWGPNGSTPPNRGATSPPKSPPNGHATSPPTRTPNTLEARVLESEAETQSLPSPTGSNIKQGSVGATPARAGTRAPARTTIPPDWKPDAKQESYAINLSLGPDPVARRFVLWHRRKGTLSPDWAAEWEWWCDNEVQRVAEQNNDHRGNGMVKIIAQEGWVSARRNSHDREVDGGAKVIEGMFGHA